MPQPATSSYDLIERFRGGDQDAFARLFEKYRRRLGVLVHYKLSPGLRGVLEVDDILQDVFFLAARDIGQFQYRSPGSFLSWLARIADHVMADAARHAGRQKRAGDMTRFRSESNPLGPEPAVSQTPSRLFAQEESVRRLIERLDALPEDYRQAILLAKMEGLTTAEMAERMGRPREAVSLLVHRAVQRFRHLEKKP
jgi:RNA polymerase sigma-70 factor, ECF subfamily